MNKRILDHPILGSIKNKQEITFTFDGKEYKGFEGDTIASALMAKGIRTLRKHEESGRPRGIYCNIGHCYECRVTVDGKQGIRACLTPITNGMTIESGKQLDHPLKKSSNQKDLPRTYTDYVNIRHKKAEEDPHV